MQIRCDSSALAMELHLFCIKPLWCTGPMARSWCTTGVPPTRHWTYSSSTLSPKVVCVQPAGDPWQPGNEACAHEHEWEILRSTLGVPVWGAGATRQSNLTPSHSCPRSWSYCCRSCCRNQRSCYCWHWVCWPRHEPPHAPCLKHTTEWVKHQGPVSRYGHFHDKDNTVVRSYLHHGQPYIVKTASL